MSGRQQFRTTASYARPDRPRSAEPGRVPQLEADVSVPLAQAVLAAAAIAICLGVLLLLFGAPRVQDKGGSLWALAAFSGKVAVGVFVVAAAGLLVWYVLEQWLARSRQLREPRPEPEPKPAPPREQSRPPIEFQAHARTDTGRIQIGRFWVDPPAAGEEVLARWFWRVARQNGVGFSINVAESGYGITREECGAIQQAFIDAGHATAHYRMDGQLARVDLNADGLQALWEYVWQHFPHARPVEREAV
ncbi:MAG TPA: hypothetical protein VM537_28120 [Anaerolineae bacterium]|nr:hypothetical protein [Anaerolineae bacterium]